MRYEGAKRNLIHVIMGHLYSIVMLQKSNLICSEQIQIQIVPIHSYQTADDSQSIQSICDGSELTRVNNVFAEFSPFIIFLSYQFLTSWTAALHNFFLFFSIRIRTFVFIQNESWMEAYDSRERPTHEKFISSKHFLLSAKSQM